MSNKNGMSEVFVSVDIEADGPIPIANSMLALGAVVFTPEQVIEKDCFEINIQPLPAALPNVYTMEWWSKHKEAWDYIHINPQAPPHAMYAFDKWLKEIADKYKCKPRFAGYPANYDFMFVYTYSYYTLGRCEFSHNSFDAKSYAMALQKLSFSDTVKSKLPKEWFSYDAKHTHRPLEDAIEQAYMMSNMIRSNLQSVPVA